MDFLLSDLDSFSESSSSKDQDDIESLFGGQARSIFSSLEETIEKIDDFLLFERGFVHGDIVCSVSNPLGQTGKVVSIDMTVDLENISGTKIRNVSSKYLQKICSISVGDYVVQGPWLGKVEKVVDNLTIMFDDGTKGQVTAAGPEKIVAVSPDVIEDLQYPFYPGQRVQVESSSVSRPTHWLCGMGKDKRDIGTVCNVEAGLVYVDWLSSAVIDPEKRSMPPCLQEAKNLSVLSSIPHANWQLGDWCVIPTEHMFTNASGLVKEHKLPEMACHSAGLGPNPQQIAVIVKTKSKVDVQWQDGSQSLGLDSHVLFPVNNLDVHDFWPDTFVLEKGSFDEPQAPSSCRWGVVKCVDSKEKTVTVKWSDSEGRWIEEIVSAYELVEHPDYSYCVGEPVFGIDKGAVDPTDSSCVGSWTVAKISMGEEAGFKAVEHGGDGIEYPSNNFLSRIGIVVGSIHSHVEVKWATGATSKVAPYEIYKIDKCEGTTASFLVGDENILQSNEEFPAKENHLFGQNISMAPKDASPPNRDDSNSTSYSLPQFAHGFFTSITSSLFGSVYSSLVNPYSCTTVDGQPPEEESLELCSLNLDVSKVAADDLAIPGKIDAEQNTGANEHILLPADSNHPGSFRQFDMVNDCSDHHFFGGSGMALPSTQVRKGWLKKVQQEWSILEKDLPETIYVRAYEERMDLLRAAIIGTAGTPYHDGLFFFDIYLPPEYPCQPPMVYYNSGGLRINPNLYESGKVCLSLLNTWTGSSNEVWNPESSTILQILLSLQALVLNEKPYFNEAGYDSQIGKAEGEKNSVSYNENVFLVSCRSMLYLLRRPPKHFVALLEEHFRQCGKEILLACEAYMQGAPVGHPFGCGTGPESENQNASSTGFKIMLGKLIPRLVEAFSDKGVDCSNLLDLQLS